MEPAAAHFIVATAGHVDHGKSALVKALTGTDPDRLPEEKARGITIDLGFAHLELPAVERSVSNSGGPGGGTLSLGLVDVPGHEDFVKNMVAGVGSIDLALFVVAADDGWMPQTEEHLQILSYLGVRHAVVALTKIDLASDREPAAIEQLRSQLRDTPFQEAPIVPTSVLTGRGLEALKHALATTLASTPAPADVGKPRLPIDRAFTLHGIGTVVTGTLNGGTLRRSQAVVVQPSGQTTRIRSLQSHGREMPSAAPGARTALNLPDLPVAGDAANGVSRGQVITIAELGHPTRTLDVWLEKSARVWKGPDPDSQARPLKDGTRVWFHHGSGHVPARVVLLDTEPLRPGGQGLGQIRTEQPVFALAGDRFVLRDWPEQNTLAGGLVLETTAPRRLIRNEPRRALLLLRARNPENAAVWLETELRRDRARKRQGLLAQTRLGNAEIQDAIARLTRENKVRLDGDWVLDSGWWQEQIQFCADTIRAEHQAHPELPGLALSEWRRVLDPRLPDPALSDLLLAELGRQGFVQVGTAIRHQSHRLALPLKLQSAGGRLRTLLAAKPFEPPGRKELAPDPLAQQALRFLIDSGEAIEIAPDLVMLADPFGRARELVRRMIQERGPATVSELRQALGTSRRVIVPLLERLDRDGVTLRQGDTRVLRSNQRG